MGHVDWMITHDIHSLSGGPGYTITANKGSVIPASTPLLPFSVIRASRDIVDGHSGMFKEPFMTFVADLVFAHVSLTHSRLVQLRMRRSIPLR